MPAPLSFSVGPSKVDEQLPHYFKEAFDAGVPTWSHRGRTFKTMLRETFSLLRERLCIPEDYEVVVAASARECWEIVAQSFTKKGSLHLFNGAFGAKWQEVRSTPTRQGSEHNPLPRTNATPLPIPTKCLMAYGMSCASRKTRPLMAHKSTVAVLKVLRARHADQLIAVDADLFFRGGAAADRRRLTYGLPRCKSVWVCPRVWPL